MNKGGYEDTGLFNLGMKYSFDKGFRLIADINDVFDKGTEQLMLSQYLDLMGWHYSVWNAVYQQQGRTYYMTVEYEF